MESRKDIGRAFREKLDLLQKQPGDAVWDSIRADLDKGRSKGVVPAWLRYWLISGVFLLAVFFSYPLWKNNVPRVYIEMPRQENEQGTVKAPERDNASAPYTTGKNSNEDTNVGTASGTAGTNSTGGAPDNATGTVTNSASAKGTFTAPDAKTTPGEAIVAADNNTSSAGKGSKQAKITKKGTGTASISSASKNNTASGSQRSSRAPESAVRIKSSSPAVAAHSSTTGRTSKEHKQTKIASVNRPAKPSVDKGTAAGKTASVASNDDEDTGFIVPRSTDYQNYRNNIGTGIIISDVPKDTLEDVLDRDSIKITDKLKIRTTGVQQVVKAPETKPQTDSYKNFYAFGFVAPVSYSSDDNGTYLDPGTTSYRTSSKAKMGYGISLGYRASENLSIRAGVIVSGAEVETNNLIISNSYVTDDVAEPTAPQQFKNIEYNNGITNNLVRQQLSTGTDMMAQAMANVNVRTELSFVEVPFEVTYTIFNSNNFGLGLKGIAGARFLTENKVYAENTMGRIELGKLKNIDDFSFSAGLGVSFYYQFLPSLQFNLEPGLRYFSGSKDVLKPTAFMVQAGLQYNFDLFTKKK